MLTNILKFFNSLHHTTKKDDVIDNLNMTFNELHDKVLPSLDNIISVLGNSIVIKKNNVLSLLAVSSGIKVKDNRDMLVKLKGILTNISKSEKNVKKLVNDYLPDTVTDKTATVRDLTILKLISDLSSLTMYSLDFLYYILTSADDSDYPKIKFQQIQNDIPDFSSVLRSYKDNFTKTLDNIKKVANVEMITEPENIGMFEKVIGRQGKIVNTPAVNGFLGNPIYHIRLMLVDREVDKYENLKDKKKLLELRVMELKAKENGESNPKITKQIEYYEDKIAKVEYNISQIEDED